MTVYKQVQEQVLAKVTGTRMYNIRRNALRQKRGFNWLWKPGTGVRVGGTDQIKGYCKGASQVTQKDRISEDIWRINREYNLS